MLKAITTCDAGETVIGVEDTEGGTWWPDETTQSEIQRAGDPMEKAKEICEAHPMRGIWKN